MGEPNGARPLSQQARELYIAAVRGEVVLQGTGHVIMELVAHKLLEPDPLRPGSWAPCDPRAAAQWQASAMAETIGHNLVQLRTHLTGDTELVAEYVTASGVKSSELERIPDPALAGLRIRNLAESCAGEILTAQPIREPRTAGVLATSRRMDSPMHERNGMRIVYPLHVRASAEHRAQARFVAAKGCETRTLLAEFPRLMIFGELHAVFEDSRIPAGLDGTPRPAVIVHEPLFVAHLRQQFESLWRTATPFTGDESQPAAGERLTPAQHEMMRLLLLGNSRVQVAEALGKSESWVVKMIVRLKGLANPVQDVGLLGLGFWYHDYLRRHGMA